jgi:hypothetical protein
MMEDNMTRYICNEPNLFTAKTFDEHIEKWEQHLAHLKEMRAAGMRFEAMTKDEAEQLDGYGGMLVGFEREHVREDVVEYWTDDPAIASKFLLVSPDGRYVDEDGRQGLHHAHQGP